MRVGGDDDPHEEGRHVLCILCGSIDDDYFHGGHRLRK